MPVCRFYMQGNCRYGSSCNFEHPRDQRNYQDQNRVYRYQSSQLRPSSQTNYHNIPTNDKQSQPNLQDKEILDDNEFLEHIRNEMSIWFNSSMWKFSCFSYSKTAPCIPILHDISPEEARFTFYEAKAKNNLPQAINEYYGKLNEIMNILKQFIDQNNQTREFLLNYFNQPKKNVEQNPFMKIAQQKQFQQTQAQVPNQFSQLVAQQSTSQMQTPSFGFGANIPKVSEPSLFNSATPNQDFQIPFSSPMETNFFSQIVQMKSKPAHQSETSFFGNSLPLTVKEEQSDNNLYYTQINEINKHDLDEFKSNNFTIGRIPSVPPAKELC